MRRTGKRGNKYSVGFIGMNKTHGNVALVTSV